MTYVMKGTKSREIDYRYPYFQFAHSNKNDRSRGVHTHVDSWFDHFKSRKIPCVLIEHNSYHSVWRSGQEAFRDEFSISEGNNTRCIGNHEPIPEGAKILKECYGFVNKFLKEEQVND